MLGMVLECHEGTIGYDRLLLKDCHVLVIHNFIETGNSHEHKCNRHFRKLLAHLRDIHSKDSWYSYTTDITSYTEVLTLDTLAGSQFQLIFTTELLGMVFACHEGTIGYDRLLLKDRHVWNIHNFTKIEIPINTNATGTFASFWHVCETLIEALSCSLLDYFWIVKVPITTKVTNERRQHGITWNQTNLGLTSKHFQPKPDLSRNNTPRWTSANQPQNSQSIRKALQKKNTKPAPLERFPHETQWYDSLWFNIFGADLTTTKTRFRSPLLKLIN